MYNCVTVPSICYYVQVLDHNVEFGHTKGFLVFLLKLLGYSAAPDMADFKAEQEEKASASPSYTLGALPHHLQAPWLRVFFVILYKVSGSRIQWTPPHS